MKMYTLVLVFFATGIFSCKNEKGVREDRISIDELGHGRSAAKILSVDKLESSPSGKHLTTGDQLNIVEKTDRINLEVGTQFGVEYIIKSRESQLIPITIVWTFPKGMKNEIGKDVEGISYTVTKMTNDYTYSNYTIENKNEMIRGDWTLKVYYESRLLLERTFHLI